MSDPTEPIRRERSRVRCVDRLSRVLIVVWPRSSFHRWVAKGVYDLKWGSAQEDPERVSKYLHNFGE